tara:strand:- start:179 stop:511 length:333 start_codon:yes stop_codon:yes gene_type:complete
MTTFIRLSTKEYPLHEGDVRLQISGIPENLTGDEFPCPDIYARVEWVDEPDYNRNSHIAEELAPVQENGVWKMQWAIRELTDDEKEYQQMYSLDFSVERVTVEPLTVERI